MGTDIGWNGPASKFDRRPPIRFVQELGITIGVAVLGSLTTAVYRSQLTTPDGLARDEVAAFTDSLSAATAIADQLPAGALVEAQQVFTMGLNIASGVAGGAIVVVAVLCMRMLRHVPRLGQPKQPNPKV